MTRVLSQTPPDSAGDPHATLALEIQLEAAARGSFEGLLGVVVEVVVVQAATGRCRREGALRVHAHAMKGNTPLPVGCVRVAGWVRWQGSRPERLQGRISLQGLGDRHGTRGAEVVAVEAAHTA